MRETLVCNVFRPLRQKQISSSLSYFVFLYVWFGIRKSNFAMFIYFVDNVGHESLKLGPKFIEVHNSKTLHA